MGLAESKVVSLIFRTRNRIELSSEPTTIYVMVMQYIIMTLKHYDLDESKALNRFCLERGLSDSSKRKYKSA